MRTPFSLEAMSRAAAANDAGENDPDRIAGSRPDTSERTSTCTPAMYTAGSASSHAPSPMRAVAARALEVRALRLSATALGMPVDPEVVTTTAVPAGKIGRAHV